MQIEVALADITTVRAEVLVTAANSALPAEAVWMARFTVRQALNCCERCDRSRPARLAQR
jgi:hypothetical protein